MSLSGCGFDVPREIASLERESEGLADDLSRLEGLEREVDSLEEDRDQLQDLCTEVDRLELEQATFKKLFDELSEAREQLKKISTKSEDLQAPLQYDDSKQKALFERCMGLEFKLTEDRAISLVFRNLTPHDPEQRCVITMDISEQNQWAVVSMEPHVSGVRTLLNDLNRTGNLSLFCKAVRNKFKDHCANAAAKLD